MSDCPHCGAPAAACAQLDHPGCCPRCEHQEKQERLLQIRAHPERRCIEIAGLSHDEFVIVLTFNDAMTFATKLAEAVINAEVDTAMVAAAAPTTGPEVHA